ETGFLGLASSPSVVSAIDWDWCPAAEDTGSTVPVPEARWLEPNAMSGLCGLCVAIAGASPAMAIGGTAAVPSPSRERGAVTPQSGGRFPGRRLTICQWI